MLVMKTTEGVFSRNNSVMLSSSWVSLVRASAKSAGEVSSNTCGNTAIRDSWHGKLP